MVGIIVIPTTPPSFRYNKVPQSTGSTLGNTSTHSREQAEYSSEAITYKARVNEGIRASYWQNGSFRGADKAKYREGSCFARCMKDETGKGLWGDFIRYSSFLLYYCITITEY